VPRKRNWAQRGESGEGGTQCKFRKIGNIRKRDTHEGPATTQEKKKSPTGQPQISPRGAPTSTWPPAGSASDSRPKAPPDQRQRSARNPAPGFYNRGGTKRGAIRQRGVKYTKNNKGSRYIGRGGADREQPTKEKKNKTQKGEGTNRNHRPTRNPKECVRVGKKSVNLQRLFSTSSVVKSGPKIRAAGARGSGREEGRGTKRTALRKKKNATKRRQELHQKPERERAPKKEATGTHQVKIRRGKNDQVTDTRLTKALQNTKTNTGREIISEGNKPQNRKNKRTRWESRQALE